MPLSEAEFESIYVGPKWIQVASLLNFSTNYPSWVEAKQQVQSASSVIARLLDDWIAKGHAFNKVRLDGTTPLSEKQEKAKTWAYAEELLDGAIGSYSFRD